MNLLGVNVDHVATVRQARRTDEPDPAWAAMEAQLGGADNITFHLREDRRHINDRDAEVLKATVTTRLNMEMSVAAEIIKIALRLKPDQCTLVPERREEVTTEGGLDVVRMRRPVSAAVRRLRGAGIECSAFIEPVEAQVRGAAACGFGAIELWTGSYAHARDAAAREAELRRLSRARALGSELGLAVHCGHGITYRNVRPLAELRAFEEFNIGHSIVSRAFFVGLREAVREMKRLLAAADGGR